jgi:hypothetical protein
MRLKRKPDSLGALIGVLKLAPHDCPRGRLGLILRSLDGRLAGCSYRAVAEVLFGPGPFRPGMVGGCTTCAAAPFAYATAALISCTANTSTC